MASIAQCSQSELGRVYELSYQGKPARLCLAFDTALTINSTTAQWDAVELASANGYARQLFTPAAGSYDSAINMFKSPDITLTFTASGAGFSYNRAYLVLGTLSGGVTTWNTYISYLIIEPETVALAPGVSKPYAINLLSNDITVSPL
jgi:hypothetical protein